MTIQPATHQKFSFETEFDDAGGVAFTPVRPKRLFTAAEVEVLRAEAYAAGELSVTALAETAAAKALGEIGEAASLGPPWALANPTNVCWI
jgi:flagellar assembly protein FliH